MEGEQVKIENIEVKSKNGGKAVKPKKDKIYGFDNYDAKRLQDELVALKCDYKGMSKWPVEVKKVMLKYHQGIDAKKKAKAEKKKKLAETEAKTDVVSN